MSLIPPAAYGGLENGKVTAAAVEHKNSTTATIHHKQ